MSKFETKEAALEAQTAKAAQVKDAKQALSDYFKTNKLKKTEDYSEDAKHGKKIMKLEAKVDKYSDELITINEAVKKFKAGKEKSDTPRNLKYEYPDDVKTAEQRKKWRIAERKKAAGGEEGTTKKEKPAKAAKAKKAEKEVEEEEVTEAPAKKAKSKSKAKAEPAEEKAPAKGKSKSKKRKEEDSEGEDD